VFTKLEGGVIRLGGGLKFLANHALVNCSINFLLKEEFRSSQFPAFGPFSPLAAVCQARVSTVLKAWRPKRASLACGALLTRVRSIFKFLFDPLSDIFLALYHFIELKFINNRE
jgi:hypothetical protein